MSDTYTDEELEQVAQNEVFPEVYGGHRFPGEWVNEKRHEKCLALARERMAGRAQTEAPENEVEEGDTDPDLPAPAPAPEVPPTPQTVDEGPAPVTTNTRTTRRR